MADSKNKLHSKIDFKIDNLQLQSELGGEYSFEIKSYPRPYCVQWDNNAVPMERINNILSENPNNFLFIDSNVFNIYKDHIICPDENIFIGEATEEFKTIKGVLDLIGHLEKKEFTKSDNLIVVGGGVIQDVAAFAGVCFKRGISWIFFPTTLLSICDSCIGAKTGINHNNVKNQLALFSAPSQIVINTKFLQTLERIEIYSGLGEVIKFHIMAGKYALDFYSSIIKNGKISSLESLELLIINSLKIKKAVIEVDEYELNYRRSLNYGHTIGHALEVLSNYKITHGMAIIVGMLVANEISRMKGLLTSETNNYINRILTDMFNENNHVHLEIESIDELRLLLKKDKKTMGKKINFAVMSNYGEMNFLPINIDDKIIDEIPQIIKSNFNLL